jgi:hypothetical protein
MMTEGSFETFRDDVRRRFETYRLDMRALARVNPISPSTSSRRSRRPRGLWSRSRGRLPRSPTNRDCAALLLTEVAVLASGGRH